jgi:glycosyltransferase involved in cell wall biosynthesis
VNDYASDLRAVDPIGLACGPLHIVIVIAGLGAGGAERVISLIAGDWVARGHLVSLVSFDEPGAPIFHAFDPRIRLVRLGVRAARGRLAGMHATVRRLRALRRELDDLSPDIVISFLTKINVLTLLASLGTGRPVIVSERNNPHMQQANHLWAWMIALLHWRADGIVMQTQASLECLRAAARRRACVIPNPITISPIAGPARGGFVLAAVGRLTWQKGFDLLIKAFAHVADRHPDWQLVIWGEGDARPALERQIVDEGLSGRITLPGNSASPDVWTGQADAFVMSSRYEGFGNALCEAMAAGLPVVSFDCDYGPGEIIDSEENGVLVPKGDVEALAAALDRLMANADLRARLGLAARTVAARFDPSTIVERWDEIVASVLASRSTVTAARPVPC